MRERPVIAITAGDVAGIGPEVVVRAIRNREVASACDLLVICHPSILERAIKLCKIGGLLRVKCIDLPESRSQLRSRLKRRDKERTILCLNPCGDEASAAPLRAPGSAAGNAAFHYLTTAIELALNGTVDAITTAPLNKTALHAAGHRFPGHTEILANRCGSDDFAMMLHLPESHMVPLRNLFCTAADSDVDATCGLSINHVTLHTSIQSIPGLLSTHEIISKTKLMHRFLNQIGCDRAAIAVCALNPHGGEQGLFGDEESRIIGPAVNTLRDSGLNVTGPLPVDTLIRRAVAGEFDGVVAMYHDQGHIPVKLIGFDTAVNITLGLPIVRTSPTHGTAFDRAWDPSTPADESGMKEAILTAARLAHVHTRT